MSKKKIEEVVEKDWEARLVPHNLPPTPGRVLDARWVMGQNDWWVKTDKGWFWLDPRSNVWKPSIYGPSY